LFGDVSQNNITPSGKPFAIYHSWDDVATRVSACLPLTEENEGNDKIASGFTYAGNALKVIHIGPYTNSGSVHKAIHAYIKDNAKEYAGSPWEIYINGPGSEPDPNNYITKIYYPIK